MRPPGRRVPRSFLARHASVVAPELLGKVLWVDHGQGDRRAGRIVEVEAYGGADDPASHAFRGPTPRNRPMFGRAGTVYVYFTYGMHWCANVVTGRTGDGQAVLIRAVEPVLGIEAMRRARPRARRDRDLSDGPAKLCQALGIGPACNGVDLLGPVPAEGPELRLLDDGAAPPAAPRIGPRVGISAGTDTLWRFWS